LLDSDTLNLDTSSCLNGDNFVVYVTFQSIKYPITSGEYTN